MEEEKTENIDIDLPVQTRKPNKKLIIFSIVTFILFICTALIIIVTTNKRVKAPTPKAYFATAKAWFLPSTAPAMQVGDAFPVYLVADFGTLDVVGFAIKITYPPDKLELISGISDIVINSGFTSEVKKEIKATVGEIYLSFVNINGVSGLLGLDNPWVKFNFTVKSLGTADLALDKTYSSYQIVGVNSGTDSLIELKNETGGDQINISYTIAAALPTSLPTSVTIPTTTPTLSCTSSCTTRKQCVSRCQNSRYYCIKGTCLIPTPPKKHWWFW